MYRLTIVLAAAVTALSAQDDLTARIGDIFKEWNIPDTPGAAVAVVKDGKLAYQKGFGSANLEYGVPIAPVR